ncbi:hypothetical protein [Nocardioides ferulae]|uniref:hypothetical protein n=1 Tax=Nocardioides ferulae TaxID=2340821 RepID=UPI000EAD7BBC|nr:hypothetical protein [Nocardioides ferulae]
MSSRRSRTLGRASLAVLLAGLVAWPVGAAGNPADPAREGSSGWSVRDLGTLPGHASSEAAGVDRGIVVGTSYDESLASRAFAYDIGTGRMRDLGTLGGESSGATAIDGDTVVGWSDLAGGGQHAFAFDLEDGSMRDLGALDDGRYSVAADVDGEIVVGSSDGGGHSSRPFAFDLATGELTALALLPGGSFGQALGVDGDLVVGWSDVPDEGARAVVHDLSAGTVIPLETLSGDDAGWAYAVDGGTVVGESLTTIASEAFVYDVRTGSVRGLGLLLLGDRSAAYAVDGGLVAGRANVYTEDDAFYWHAVLRPVGRGSWSRLPEPAGSWSSEAHGIDASTGQTRVAGTLSTRDGDRAVLWTRQPEVTGARPVVRGTPAVGKRLTVQRGSWSPAGVTLTQRWLRDGKAIRGATGTRYRVVRADRGHRLSVAVTGHKAGYSTATMTSAPVKVRR